MRLKCAAIRSRQADLGPETYIVPCSSLRHGPEGLHLHPGPRARFHHPRQLVHRSRDARGGARRGVRTHVAAGVPCRCSRRARQLLRLRHRGRARVGHARPRWRVACDVERLSPSRRLDCRGIGIRRGDPLPVSCVDVLARWSTAGAAGIRRGRRLGPLRSVSAAVSGRTVGTIRIRQPGLCRDAARRGARRDSRGDGAVRLSDRPPAILPPPRLHHRVQLEGLHRQLPRRLPPARRASEPVS